MNTLGLTDLEIAELESGVGALPDDVRSQYRLGDGLKGPTDCDLLYTRAAMREMSQIHQEDWFPPAFQDVVIVGDDGVGNLICWDNTRHRAKFWNPADGGAWIQEERGTVSEIWEFVREWYAGPVGVD